MQAVPGQDVEFIWYTLAEDAKDPSSRSKLCTKGTECSEAGAQAEALFDKRDKSLPVEPLEKRSEVETGIEDGVPFSKLKLSPVYTDDRQIYICQVNFLEKVCKWDFQERNFLSIKSKHQKPEFLPTTTHQILTHKFSPIPL